MPRRASEAVRRAAVLALVLGLAAGCGWPRDPERTLERVRGGVLRVGVTERPPWTRRGDGPPSGVEADLVQRLAAGLRARVVWRWGTLDEHMEALTRHELDLVVGGLTAATPWKAKVGLTRPYYTTRIAVGVRPPQAPPADVSGRDVAVEQGSALAARVRQAGARPVRVADPARATGPVAAPTWQLDAWGFRYGAAVLHREPHVLAVAPGENAWLLHVERFLSAERAAVEPRLLQQARR